MTVIMIIIHSKGKRTQKHVKERRVQPALHRRRQLPHKEPIQHQHGRIERQRVQKQRNEEARRGRVDQRLDFSRAERLENAACARAAEQRK